MGTLGGPGRKSCSVICSSIWVVFYLGEDTSLQSTLFPLLLFPVVDFFSVKKWSKIWGNFQAISDWDLVSSRLFTFFILTSWCDYGTKRWFTDFIHHQNVCFYLSCIVSLVLSSVYCIFGRFCFYLCCIVSLVDFTGMSAPLLSSTAPRCFHQLMAGHLSGDAILPSSQSSSLAMPYTTPFCRRNHHPLQSPFCAGGERWLSFPRPYNLLYFYGIKEVTASHSYGLWDTGLHSNVKMRGSQT